MTYLLAVDPGKNALGWALFRNGILERCGYEVGGSPLENARQLEANLGVSFYPDILIVEGQQVYGYSKIDANDLLPLAECVGAVKALMTGTHTEIVHPVPSEWKGNVAKKVFTNRIREIIKARPHDQAVVNRDLKAIPESLKHNPMDAIGLGYWNYCLIGPKPK